MCAPQTILGFRECLVKGALICSRHPEPCDSQTFESLRIFPLV